MYCLQEVMLSQAPGMRWPGMGKSSRNEGRHGESWDMLERSHCVES